jgi:hypothetical protein
MRFGVVSTITLLLAVGFLGCVPGSRDKEPTPGSGGVSGGTTSSGGVKDTGGTTASGGQASGGTTATGSNQASGGSASGGIASAGGNSAGGTNASGGATARGGAGGGAGGINTRDGSIGSGGATTPITSTAVCTDTLPPDRTETCAQWVSWNTCSQDWFKTYCNKSCGRCTGGGNGGAGGVGNSGGSSGKGGSTGGGGVSSPGTTNPPITGSNGWATRYWDCCKPSCSWTTNVPSCQKDGTSKITDKNAKSGCEGGGSAFECYDFSPWYDASTNMSYGFAAKNGVNCGSCWMLQFTGEGNSGANPGAAALKGQQMVVQAINIGGIDQNQFDLLIPGGGVGLMTEGCKAQWGSSTDLGVTYGGLLAECKGDATCMKGKCQSVFGSFPALKAGCDWFTGWYSSADNPKVIYKQVSCPSQITSKTGVSG